MGTLNGQEKMPDHKILDYFNKKDVSFDEFQTSIFQKAVYAFLFQEYLKACTILIISKLLVVVIFAHRSIVIQS